MQRTLGIAVVWATAFTAGCRPAPPPAKASAAKAEIVVFAAASTQDSIEAITREFEQCNPEIHVQSSFASSGALAQQIAAGASADLFLSASLQWVDYLQEKNLLAESHDLLGNQLVAIVAAESMAPIAKPEDLLKDEVEHLALADPEVVPAGIYAKLALVNVGIWKQVKGKVVAGNDVRHALAMVETGAVEAAIVYATDAAASKKVKLAFAFDSELTGPILYPLTLLKRSDANSAARELYQFFQSPAAAAVFRRSGFHVEQAIGVR